MHIFIGRFNFLKGSLYKSFGVKGLNVLELSSFFFLLLLLLLLVSEAVRI
jgi:hypothetical protein